MKYLFSLLKTDNLFSIVISKAKLGKECFPEITIFKQKIMKLKQFTFLTILESFL